MSTLRLRTLPSGRQVYYLYFSDSHGRRQARSCHTSVRRDAKLIQEEVDHQLATHRFAVFDKLPLEKIFTKRLQYLKALARPESTIKLERCIYATFSRFVGAEIDPSWLQDKVAEYAGWRLDQQISITRINLELRHLKALFRWGSKRHICKAVTVEFLKPPHRLATFLSEEEVVRLFGAIKDETFLLALELYLNTGARKNEISTLTWNDVDLSAGVLYFRNTKAGKERRVPIHSGLLERLRTWKSTHPDVERLFPYNGDWLYRKYKSSAQQAGITDPQKLRLHCLRHTFVSKLIMQGVDITTVSDLLGHSNIGVTVSYYSHLTDAHKRAAIDSLDWHSATKTQQ